MLTPIFTLILLTGFAFMVIWAVRFATKQQLKYAISWFLGIGIVGSLLAGTLSVFAQHRFKSLQPGFDSSYLMMGGKARGGGKDGWFGYPYADEAKDADAASSVMKK